MSDERKAWSGGWREVATAEAVRSQQEEARTVLRDRHAAYLRACGPRFRTRPFKSHVAPGWVYLPVEDVAILSSTYDEIRGRFRFAEDPAF